MRIKTTKADRLRFTFTGKDPRKGWRTPLNYKQCSEQRDEETGYSYFGARYYDPETSGLWLSVDPMADKYQWISPYAYCAWNPMRLVDPDGKMIDDYFSFDGKYLGSDNFLTNNVRILSESTWNSMRKDPVGNIEHAVGYVLSTDFASASRNGMSDDAQLKVYEHYNPTKYKLEKLDVGKNTWGMRTTQTNMTDPVIKIRLEGNRNGLEICNNADEITNLFEHEKGHINQCQTLGFSNYKQLTKNEQESFAVSSQMSAPSWARTRQSFKDAFNKYGKKYGLFILKTNQLNE